MRNCTLLLLFVLFVSCTRTHAEGAFVLDFNIVVKDANNGPIPGAKVWLLDRDAERGVRKAPSRTVVCTTSLNGVCVARHVHAFSTDRMRWLWDDRPSRNLQPVNGL